MYKFVFGCINHKIYKPFRVVVAVAVGVVAVAWIVERFFEQPNFISAFVQNYARYAPFAVLALAVLVGSAFKSFPQRRKGAKQRHKGRFTNYWKH